MARFEKIKPILSVLFPLFILVSIFSFTHTEQVKSQTTQKTCADIGYDNIPDTNSFEANSCSNDYASCIKNPVKFDSEYYTCVGAGGCWDIGRWVYVEENNCPIDNDGNLDYSHHFFNEDTADFAEGNLNFCKCVADCQKKYSTKKDCESQFDSCCKALQAETPKPPDSNIDTTTDPIKLSQEIQDISEEQPDLCKSEESNQAKLEANVREMVQRIVEEIDVKVTNRSDLSTEQKATIIVAARQAAENIRVKKCGEGSLTGGCNFLWMDDCLYIDPLSSPDTIRHELGHLIAQAVLPGYQEPSGDSSHEMEGYSSSEHRAFDEALATLIASDLMGKSTYISHSSGKTIDTTSLSQMSKTGIYEVDYETLTITVKTQGSTLIYGENGSPANRLEWLGPKTAEEGSKILTEIDNRLGLIKQEMAKGANADHARIDGLFRKTQTFLRLLNPPAHSSKNEVAVGSLIYDITGDSPSSERLGKIIKAFENYNEVKGRGPTTELEFLQGYLKGKSLDSSNPKDSSEFGIIYVTVNSKKHWRVYKEEDLILK